MICQVCGARIAPEDWDTAMDRVPYGEGEVEMRGGVLCPVCGSEAVSIAEECLECGGDFAKEELDGGLCRLCVAALNESLDWMWDQLSVPQRQWAAMHPEWMER